MAITTQQTIFTRDILGRYVCNTFSEATQSGPFDVIIIGGGMFGLSLAQDLYFRSQLINRVLGGIPPGTVKPPNYRVLVLEAGPFTLPEHTQDIPNLQLYPPGAKSSASVALPATRAQLIAQGLDKQPILENWGLAWSSTEPFGGLAYCLGGRSLYWGGWSPQYLDTEMPTAAGGSITADNLWPPSAIEDLKVRFFTEAAEQTGVTTSNDYINGDLHDFYRQKLFLAYSGVPHQVPLAELPDYTSFAGPKLQSQLDTPPYPGFKDSVKLDAPLAVQIQTRPGFFPFNKFSSPPLAITAARDAAQESAGNDAIKRLMIVPNCHVKGLRTRTYTLATGATVQEVDGIDTGDGFLDLSGPVAGNSNRRPVVILAMGAIESARLALLSVGGVPNSRLMGVNLMVHLRKNVLFSAPMPAGITVKDLELTALLVRCRTTSASGTPAHFHFQITASAMPPGAPSSRSDALLFQSVPDLDNVRLFRETTPGTIDVAIRAVGEMLPNPQNTVTVPLQPPDNDEFSVPRATVAVARSQDDVDLMNTIDQVIDYLALNIFGTATNASAVMPDDLGTTYHESGTLRMGDDPIRSVVNAEGQFHYVTNLYAGDASVLPTCGSANPSMNGIALRRRLAKRLVPEGDGGTVRPFARPAMSATPLSPGAVIALFDGQTLANWRLAGRGTFHAIDGAIQSVPSFDLGLLWCTLPMPQNYRLELELFLRTSQTNSGVFIRFKHPDSLGYFNPAWSAVDSGFEVQIDNTGAPDGLPKHKTGAVYNVNYPGDPSPNPNVPPATPGDFVNPQAALVFAWNQYRIEVQGDVITVNLNGVDTAQYTNPDPNRGRFSPTEATFVGLQSYSNYGFTTAFRNIRVTVL
jgi:choline dehydrogenase-like flavoprotein